MTSQQQFRNIVFLGTFIVIFWGCVFGRSAAVGLNAAFISTVLQRSAAASRLSEAVHTHGLIFIVNGRDLKRQRVRRPGESQSRLFFNETETEARSCLLFSSTGGVWTASSTDTEPQRRSVLPSQAPAKTQQNSYFTLYSGKQTAPEEMNYQDTTVGPRPDTEHHLTRE